MQPLPTGGRPATVTRRPPVCPIPPAVFREPVYADGRPYEGTEDDEAFEQSDAA